MLKIIGLLVLAGFIILLPKMLRQGTRAGQQLRIIRRYHSRSLLNDRTHKE